MVKIIKLLLGKIDFIETLNGLEKLSPVILDNLETVLNDHINKIKVLIIYNLIE